LRRRRNHNQAPEAIRLGLPPPITSAAAGSEAVALFAKNLQDGLAPDSLWDAEREASLRKQSSGAHFVLEPQLHDVVRCVPNQRCRICRRDR
jgi:hypothetical protein